MGLMVMSILYFYPQLEGKVITQGDISSWRGMAHEANTFKKETGETTYWTNSIFGGMPTYQINANQPGSVLPYINRVLQGGFRGPIGLFFLLMLGFYVMLTAFNIGPWLSMIMAICFAISTGNMVLYEAGHVTKLRSIAYCAPIIAGVLLAYRKKWILGGILFITGLSLNIFSNHYQMTYYLFLVLMIYVIIELVDSVKSNKLVDFAKVSSFLLVCALIALSANASKLYTTYVYSKDTMRGDPILTKVTDTPISSSETDGLAWDYAMQWSNGYSDLLASFIPGVVGGGSAEKVSKDSPLRKDRIWKNVLRGNNNKAPMYWGNLPFTSGPYYFGALIFYLFILGLYVVRGKVKWWIGIAFLFTVLLSLGSNLEFLNKLLFDYMPLFNKFRTPNSVLTVSAVLMPLLGGLALNEIIRYKDEARIFNGVKWTSLIFLSVSAILLLFGASLFDFASPGDARYAAQGVDVQPLVEGRKHFFRSELLRTLGILFAGSLALWLYIKGKINRIYLLIIVGLLAITDLWLVDKRYVDSKDFVSRKNSERMFRPRPVDSELLKDKDPNYRVLDLSVNTFESSISSYHHKTIGGYNAAKLQRYQDIIDHHLRTNNMGVINMLNTKYVITQDQKSQRNGQACGNAWFVNSVQMVNTANEEIEALTALDPKATAVAHKDFDPYLDVKSYSGEGSIDLTSYAPNQLTYQSNSSGNQLAVFSEIWYGPNKGWNAYIDGKPADHIRVNYILRALKIPAGNHKIEFKFEPVTLKAMTTGSSILVILIIIGGLFYLYRGNQSD